MDNKKLTTQYDSMRHSAIQINTTWPIITCVSEPEEQF